MYGIIHPSFLSKINGLPIMASIGGMINDVVSAFFPLYEAGQKTSILVKKACLLQRWSTDTSFFPVYSRHSPWLFHTRAHSYFTRSGCDDKTFFRGYTKIVGI